ncbi:F-box/kelch-repeat protein At3g06240-like [Apium graveolens]|uniref:F-box/kelch-repeat protein At3g06240-like n=1 Tax=Apium graveolens TaxID=4045 RepID=UPI003D7B6F0A
MSTRINYINLVPQELLTEIFTRLPAKSLGRCKCVLKSWASLISDPDFIQAHLTKTKHSTNLALISTETNPGIIYSVHFFNDSKNVNCDGIASKLNLNCCNKWCKIWGSYDGLMLVQDIRTKKFLINPTTLESKKLPPVPCGYRLISFLDLFGFGYDSSCDDYVVVAICYESGSFCAYVYMLKTNQWNKVGFSPYVHLCPYDHVNVPLVTYGAAGIFVEGCLHWLAKKYNDNNSCLIASFNLAKKEFSEVPPPKGVFDYMRRRPRLGVLKGCLCLITGVYNRNELWVMKEYGVVESWVKMSVFLTEDSSIVSLDLQEDSLVMLEGGQFILLVSDAKEVILQDMKVIGLPHDFRVGMTYIDTLFSPNKIDYKKNT